MQSSVRLWLAELGEHGVDRIEGGINLLADLGTGEDDLTRHEDEEDDLRLEHAIDEAREKLEW